MNTTITLNTKVFNVTSRPTGSSAVFTTRDRGITLPDTLLIAHRSAKNAVEPGSTDKLSTVSVQRTYINADGVVKTVQVAHTSKVPDDCPSAELAACRADLTDFMASAITLRTANVAAMDNGETP